MKPCKWLLFTIRSEQTKQTLNVNVITEPNVNLKLIVKDVNLNIERNVNLKLILSQMLISC